MAKEPARGGNKEFQELFNTLWLILKDKRNSNGIYC